MWHPWRELRSLPELIVEFTNELPSGDAWWSPAQEVILMRRGLLQVERRCALAHELGHRKLGHSGLCEYADAGRQSRRAEMEADRWAAKRLVSPDQLLEVARWARSRAEAAEELWVTREILDVRLRWMHPAERRRLESRDAAGLLEV